MSEHWSALDHMQPPEGQHGEGTSSPPSLESIPPDVLAKCLRYVSLSDIHSLETCSHRCRSACQDDRVWFELCSLWSDRTDIRAWLPPFTPASPAASSPLRAPITYRQLYSLFEELDGLSGTWRIVGEGPEGGCIVFRWTSDGMRADKLVFPSLARAPERHRYATFCPRNGFNTAVEWADDANITIKLHSPLRRTPSSCQTTEAVAATSLPYGVGAAPMGSSPQGSFEAEWHTFMASNVALGRSKVKRRWSRGGGGNSGPVLHHLRRVEVPVATARHPLAGMWLAEYGPATVQLLRVTYDFSGPAARIVAEKVTGDEGVPAGLVSWVAAAAALVLPWPEEDAASVAAWQQQRWDDSLAEGDGGMDGLLLDDHNSDGSDTAQGGNGGPTTGDGQPSAADHWRVVSVHMGRGLMAGGAKVEGRLWVHGDGWLSFHWLAAVGVSVTMRRPLAHEL